jgi:uncharacterized membrane protein YidH (DUF202 family)
MTGDRGTKPAGVSPRSLATMWRSRFAFLSHLQEGPLGGMNMVLLTVGSPAWIARAFAGLLIYASLSLVASAQTINSATPNTAQQGPSSELTIVQETEKARAAYYRARTEDIQSKWSFSLEKIITGSGVLLGVLTIVLGFRQWNSSVKATRKAEDREWETLRDGQFLDQLKRLSDEGSPRARQSAAIVVAFLSMVTTNVPLGLAKALLEQAAHKEDDPDVRHAMDVAITALRARIKNCKDDGVFETLFGVESATLPVTGPPAR